MTIEHEIQVSRVPVYVFLMTFMILGSLWNYQEHNYARRDREAAMVQRDRTAVIEDRIRDVVIDGTAIPLVVYYVGRGEWGDERLITWPKKLTNLLGWTRRDIETDGLEIIAATEEDLEEARDRLKKIGSSGPDEVVIHIEIDARHKDGRVIPIKITVWPLGRDTRAFAAYIESREPSP